MASLAELHDGALAELLLDLADREIERALAVRVQRHGHSSSPFRLGLCVAVHWSPPCVHLLICGCRSGAIVFPLELRRRTETRFRVGSSRASYSIAPPRAQVAAVDDDAIDRAGAEVVARVTLAASRRAPSSRAVPLHPAERDVGAERRASRARSRAADAPRRCAPPAPASAVGPLETDPHHARPAAIGKRADRRAHSDGERRAYRAALRSTAPLQRVAAASSSTLAEKLERAVQAVVAHPAHVGAGAASSRFSSTSVAPGLGGQIDGEKARIMRQERNGDERR